MKMITNAILLAFILCLQTGCSQDSGTLLERAEIPYLFGESKQIINPKAKGYEGDKWFTNDHCFIEDKEGVLHYFGINNPYPPKGKELYRYHPYLGHLTSTDPEKKWNRQAMAIDRSKTTEYVGAPFVVWHEESQRYAMVVEVWEDSRELEVFWSDDLYNWEPSGVYLTGSVWKSSRDPHIMKGPDGKYWIHVVSHGVEGKKRSQIIRWKTTDFVNFEPAKEVLGINDNNWATLMESPFLLERNGLWYMFFTYAHRRYAETIVVVSDNPDHFDYEKNTLTTMFGHAMEIFTYKGKTYATSCGPEDQHYLNHQSTSMAELKWLKQ
ncbi:MAG: hypothetical protein N4A71_17050 [Carboxylicivirga sp.]|jgi:hypothetical protein|nr:hypothetical protein [Carboxylicivirga sp.]